MGFCWTNGSNMRKRYLIVLGSTLKLKLTRKSNLKTIRKMKTCTRKWSRASRMPKVSFNVLGSTFKAPKTLRFNLELLSSSSLGRRIRSVRQLTSSPRFFTRFSRPIRTFVTSYFLTKIQPWLWKWLWWKSQSYFIRRVQTRRKLRLWPSTMVRKSRKK